MDPLDEAKQGLMRAHTADRAKSGAQDPMDYVALGYLTPDGQATPFGDEFVAMVQGGLLEKDGTPTKEGEAYRMTHSESLEAPLEIYRLREERGLNQAEKDAAPDDGGFMGMLGKFTTEGLPRLAETFWNSYAAHGIEYATVIPRKIIEKVTGATIDLPRTKQTFDEKVNAISENITGGILASEGLASGAKYHAELAAADPGAYMQAAGDFLPGVSDLIRAVHGDETVTENIRMKADEAFAAKQRWELHNAEVAELKGAEMMDWLTDSDQWLQSRAAIVAKDGEAAVKKNEEVDRLTGNFVLDPNNIASVGVGKMISGAVGNASRIALGAEKLALRSKVLQMGHAAAVAERTTLEAGATRAAAISKGAVDRAAAMRAVGNEAQAVRYENLATKLEEKAGGLVSRVDELAATEAKLAGEIEKIGAKAGVADAIVRTTERARAIRQMPATAFGEVSERIGTALVKTDEFLADAAERVGITGVYKSMHSLPMRVGTFASSAVLGPVASAAAIGSQIMASGPFLQSIGNFSKVLGKELVMERGSVPFWRRVANNSSITKTQRFLAHRMDEATLGGMATDVARPVITGTAHAYPMNLAFEVLQNPEQDFGSAAEHAFGPSLVFGGGTAGAGAIFKGSKQRLKEVRIADELNFTRNLDDGNKAGYNGISRGARRVVSTYAAAFPNLNWDFGHAGSSHYDPTTNTARINPAGGNPLRALIGHEVLHYVTIRNQMEPVIHSMLLGDAETPGLLRAADGTLDPDFQRFRDEYDARMDAAGLERVSLQKIAEEYFNEATVDHLLEMVDSGELSKMAGRTQAGRHIRAFIAATIPRSVILKDFFFRSGGVMEAGGRRVMGNGLLADGIRELPEARAMMRNMVKKSAGEAVFQQPSEKGDRTGVPLQVQKGDPIIDSFHAILQEDANGNKIKDAQGNHILISRATDEARSSAGLIITEAQTKRVNNSYQPAPGEMKANGNGTWSGEYIDRPLIDALAAKGILNAKQIAIIRNISTATKGGQGFRFMLINHPATMKGRGGKVNYATLGATLRETVPVGFGITKDGNILVHLMSVHQLDANIQNRAATKRGRSLYNGNTEVIKQDVAAMMDLHRANTKTDKFYQDKYGAKWQEHQQFINTVFGLMTKAQAEINPMFRQDNINSPKEHVYRTYRLDRISKATKMDGTPMPFGYEKVKVNFLPDGVVDPKDAQSADLRYLPEPLEIHPTASGGSVKTKMKHSKTPVSFEAGNVRVESPGLRYLPEPVYHGTPHEVDRFTTDKIGTGEGAQAYGWGLYFAEAREVADGYRDKLSGKARTLVAADGYTVAIPKLGEVYLAEHWAEMMIFNRDGDFVTAHEKLEQFAANRDDLTPKITAEAHGILNQWEKSGVYLKPPGNLYTVKLTPEAHEFLDWDKPLSEQSEMVRNAFKNFHGVKDLGSLESRVGRSLYTDLGLAAKGNSDAIQKSASSALQKLGIKGIRYHDGNSRWAADAKPTENWSKPGEFYVNRDGQTVAEGTFAEVQAYIESQRSYNYVVFDEKDIEITHANGKPTKP